MNTFLTAIQTSEYLNILNDFPALEFYVYVFISCLDSMVVLPIRSGILVYVCIKTCMNDRTVQYILSWNSTEEMEMCLTLQSFCVRSGTTDVRRY